MSEYCTEDYENVPFEYGKECERIIEKGFTLEYTAPGITSKRCCPVHFQSDEIDIYKDSLTNFLKALKRETGLTRTFLVTSSEYYLSEIADYMTEHDELNYVRNSHYYDKAKHKAIMKGFVQSDIRQACAAMGSSGANDW